MERERHPYFQSDVLRGVAVLTLTFLAVVLIPFIGPVVVIMTPLPILYYCLRLGRMRGLAALAVSFLAVSGILGLLGHHPNISVLLMIGFSGVMLSEVLNRNYSLEKTLLVASLALLFSGLGFMIFHALRTGVGLQEMVELYVSGVVHDNVRLYEKLDVSEDQILLIRENVPQITQFFTGIFPALALSGAIVTVWLNLLAGRLLLQRKSIGFPDFGDLTSWKAPDRLVWILIASGGMTLAPSDALNTVGVNILIVCCLIYLCQGLAIAGFFFKHRKIPAIFRLLFYTLLLVQQYMLIIVIAFGLFDIWIDFRKRIAGIKDAPA
ncbi:MAG: YybS family protein [Proteobacteria bacterium]|nr:YybS family protein [Pseudomonadota bacterium]MBU2226659.1 YybS family protein [Pseudomonadota bacterium]MBU2262576.1 YybS family protein [Pseudomonadota bacterium]